MTSHNGRLSPLLSAFPVRPENVPVRSDCSSNPFLPAFAYLCLQKKHHHKPLSTPEEIPWEGEWRAGMVGHSLASTGPTFRCHPGDFLEIVSFEFLGTVPGNFRSICIYICTYTHIAHIYMIYIYIYTNHIINICIYIYTHISIILSLSLYIYIYVHMYTYIYIHIYLHNSLSLSIYIYMYTCIHIYIHTPTHTHTHTPYVRAKFMGLGFPICGHAKQMDQMDASIPGNSLPFSGAVLWKGLPNCQGPWLWWLWW